VTRNWFESLLIVAQKLGAGVRPPKFPKGSIAVGLSSHRWTWETKELPKLNEGASRTLKSQERVARGQTRVVVIWPNKTRSQGRSGERIKILLFCRGAEKQDFEGLLWGPIVSGIQAALEEARPNIWSHMYKLCKKGPGPMSNLRVREYPRTINKRRDRIIRRGEVKNARGGFDRVRGL